MCLKPAFYLNDDGANYGCKKTSRPIEVYRKKTVWHDLCKNFYWVKKIQWICKSTIIWGFDIYFCANKMKMSADQAKYLSMPTSTPTLVSVSYPKFSIYSAQNLKKMFFVRGIRLVTNFAVSASTNIHYIRDIQGNATYPQTFRDIIKQWQHDGKCTLTHLHVENIC